MKKYILIAILLFLFYKFSNMTFKSKYFKLSEFHKKGVKIPMEYMKNLNELAKNLDVLREHLKKPISINSGYRSKEHNQSVGGATNSQHLTASAVDFFVNGLTTIQVKAEIEKLIKEGKMKQGGLGLYSSWIHYDIRGTKARWNG